MKNRPVNTGQTLKGGRRCSSAEIPMQSLERNTLEQISTAQCGRAHPGAVFLLKDCSPQEGAMLEPGQSVKRKEQQRSSYGLTTTSPLIITSATLDEGGRRVRNEGPKLSLGKRGWGGVILISSSFPTTQIILTGNKLN